MIIDDLKNAEVYFDMIPRLKKGLELVRTLQDVPEGRYEGEDGIFANVQEGDTYDIDGDKYESHRKYLDVQIVCSGRELFVWADAAALTVTDVYSPEKDFQLYQGEGIPYLAKENMFYILFPHDAHKCRGMADGKPEHYRKIVLKLPIA